MKYEQFTRSVLKENTHFLGGRLPRYQKKPHTDKWTTLTVPNITKIMVEGKLLLIFV